MMVNRQNDDLIVLVRVENRIRESAQNNVPHIGPQRRERIGHPHHHRQCSIHSSRKLEPKAR